MTTKVMKRTSILTCLMMLSMCLQGCSADVMGMIEQILPIISQVMGSVGGLFSQSNSNQNQQTSNNGQLAVDTKLNNSLLDQKDDVQAQDDATTFLAVDGTTKNETPATDVETKSVDLEG